MMDSFNHFDEAYTVLHQGMVKAVAHTAVDVQKAAARSGERRSGFMDSSIYHVSTEGSDYGQASSPPKDAYLLPEVGPPEDDLTAYVAVGANYGIYEEMGTRHSPARPFFIPTVQSSGPVFEQNLSNDVASSVEGIG